MKKLMSFLFLLLGGLIGFSNAAFAWEGPLPFKDFGDFQDLYADTFMVKDYLFKNNEDKIFVVDDAKDVKGNNPEIIDAAGKVAQKFHNGDTTLEKGETNIFSKSYAAVRDNGFLVLNDQKLGTYYPGIPYINYFVVFYGEEYYLSKKGQDLPPYVLIVYSNGNVRTSEPQCIIIEITITEGDKGKDVCSYRLFIHVPKDFGDDVATIRVASRQPRKF